MRYSEIRSKDVRVRKATSCEWCGGVIAKGEHTHYRAYKWEGDFQSAHMHPDCYAAMTSSEGQQIACEGFELHEFKRGTCEPR